MPNYNKKAKLRNRVQDIKQMDVPEEDKDFVLKFKKEAEAVGLSVARILYYLNRIKKLLQFKKKPFDRMSKDDIKGLVSRIESGKITKDNGEEYSAWSKRAFKLTLKKVYQILGGYEWNSKRYPDKIDWIKTTKSKNTEKKYEILSEEDIKAIVKAADKVRDKAFIIGLYESGARIGEYLDLRIKDIEFNRHGVKLNLKGKTGARKVLLVSASPHLSNWLEHRPNQGEREAPLWTNYRGNKLGYEGARGILNRAADKAGVDKPVNPHNFRHSRATHLANELTEAQMCEYFGWVQGSNQPATYVHLSGRDVDNAILSVYGIKTGDKESNGDKLKLKTCPRCEKKNSPEAEYCSRCGSPLTKEAKRSIEEDMKAGTKVLDEEFMKNWVERIKKEIREDVKRDLRDKLSNK